MNRKPHVVYGEPHFVHGKRYIEVRKTVRRVRTVYGPTRMAGFRPETAFRCVGAAPVRATLRAVARWHGSNVRAQAASLPPFGHAGANPARLDLEEVGA
eukprot:scaffold45967_cov67-Phaeocystis_antarctica.AAC.2